MIKKITAIMLALVTVFANMLIKQTKPEIAILISIVGSVVIIIMAMDHINQFHIHKATHILIHNQFHILQPTHILIQLIAINYFN